MIKFRHYTLEKLAHNRLELEHFKQFLAENVSLVMKTMGKRLWAIGATRG